MTQLEWQASEIASVLMRGNGRLIPGILTCHVECSTDYRVPRRQLAINLLSR